MRISDWSSDVCSSDLFRRVETHFDGSVAAIGTERLHPNSITLIYRRVIRAAWAKKLLGPISEAELERWVSAVSSHSIRVGVAQDNFAAGGAGHRRACEHGWDQVNQSLADTYLRVVHQRGAGSGPPKHSPVP